MVNIINIIRFIFSSKQILILFQIIPYIILGKIQLFYPKKLLIFSRTKGSILN